MARDIHSNGPVMGTRLVPISHLSEVAVGMLRRSPDAPGLQNWVGAFEGGLPRTQMLQAFLDAPEYHSRFLP